MPYLLFILMLLSSCFVSKQKHYLQDTPSHIYGEFRIKNIEMKNDSIFIIYALKADTLFKIVSFKSKKGDCNPILIDHIYQLRLKSLLALDGISSQYSNSNSFGIMVQQLSGMIYHSNFIEFDKNKDPYIDNIFEALNLNGICIIK